MILLSVPQELGMLELVVAIVVADLGEPVHVQLPDEGAVVGVLEELR